MGYLDNTTITVDAILTKKGRELLAKGATYFNITQFALADDEVDYRLWNPNHNLGSDYYGEAITEMPILEATSNESNIMLHKLLTLDKTSLKIPIINVAASSITLNPGQTYTIIPSTVNYENGNSTFGYTAILGDADVCDITPASGYEVNITGLPTTPIDVDGEAGESVAVIAKGFTIKAKSLQYRTSTTITIIGNETGGRDTLTVTVKEDTRITR